MAYYKKVDSIILDAGMTATANAIRSKTGESASIQWDGENGFSGAITNIVVGGQIVDNNNYELVTVSQDCTNAEQARIALQSFVGANDQIVLFIREDYNAKPNADTPNNTGLWFMWFSSSFLFSSNTERRHVWARWRNNEVTPFSYTNTAYDYIVPSNTVFRKFVIR